MKKFLILLTIQAILCELALAREYWVTTNEISKPFQRQHPDLQQIDANCFEIFAITNNRQRTGRSARDCVK